MEFLFFILFPLFLINTSDTYAIKMSRGFAGMLLWTIILQKGIVSSIKMVGIDLTVQNNVAIHFRDNSQPSPRH